MNDSERAPSPVPVGDRSPALPVQQPAAHALAARQLGLRPGAGNREVGRRARTLSRKETSVTVHLVGPPPPVEAVKRATPENRKLAELIDTVEQLTDSKLLERRDALGPKTVGLGGTDAEAAAAAELAAIEFIARRRGLSPAREHYSAYDKSVTTRRLNVRALIEKGVRETGSFERALAMITYRHGIESDIEFFEAEAKRFGAEFTSQARANSERMLGGSLDTIYRALESYGMRRDAAAYTAGEVARGRDADAEIAAMVKVAAREAMEKGDADKPFAEQRGALRRDVRELREHQRKVAALQQQADAALTRVPMNTKGPAWDAYVKVHGELQAARGALPLAWNRAERSHPVLAAFRERGQLEKVDLAPLDQDTDERTSAIVAQLLPKLVNIGRARHMIRRGALSPLALPSVVALTRANMFIPDGSIRAGVANDLARSAQSDDSGLLAAAALALAIVFLLPSGGSSLGIAAVGMASAGLAAYSAVQEWDKYTKQKTLYNTDLDVARSLWTKEPSLAGFAMSLVGLGLEGLPLIGAFNKARKLRALVNAGSETGDIARATVRELNDVGRGRGAPDLGERALAEARDKRVRATPDTIPAPDSVPPPPRARPKPDAPAPKPRPDAPAPNPARAVRVEGASAYGSARQVSDDIATKLANFAHGMEPGTLPAEWPLLIRALKLHKGPVNREIVELLPTVMGGLRDPGLWGEVLADAWTIAARNGTDINQALVEMALATGKPILRVPKKAGFLAGDRFFDDYVRKPGYIVDESSLGTAHRGMIHLLQDLVVDRALARAGKKMSGADFRVMLDRAEGIVERTDFGTVKALTFMGKETRMKTGDYVWRFTYDLNEPGQMPTPEWVSTVLAQLVGLK